MTAAIAEQLLQLFGARLAPPDDLAAYPCGDWWRFRALSITGGFAGWYVIVPREPRGANLRQALAIAHAVAAWITKEVQAS